MIIYTTYCMACLQKKKWKEIKAFALKNKLKLEERRTPHKKEWQEEAQRYDLQQPFILHNGIALDVNEPLERLL